jgi:hypothetical protein
MTRADRLAGPPPHPGAPRWVRWVTYAAVLAPLPSAVWRLGLAAGLPVGFSADRLAALDVPRLLAAPADPHAPGHAYRLAGTWESGWQEAGTAAGPVATGRRGREPTTWVGVIKVVLDP